MSKQKKRSDDYSMESLLTKSSSKASFATSCQVTSIERYIYRDTRLQKTEDIQDKHHARLGEHAASLWKQNHMTDTIINADGKTFQAHKAVLTCYSPFFKRNLLNPGTLQTITIRLSGVTAEAFKVILNYMYMGELKLSCQNIGDVYKASSKLEMTETFETCANILSCDSNPENYIFQYVTAKKMGLETPYKHNLQAILEQFEEILLTTQFLNLSVDELCEIISQDSIGVRSEIIIYLAALRWLNYNFTKRQTWVIRVLGCIRFPLMNLDELLCSYYPPFIPEVTQIPEVRQQLLKGTCLAAAKTRDLEACFYQYSCPARNYLVHGDPLILWDISKHNNRYHSPSVLNLAATKIQAHMKGYFTRRKYREKRDERLRAAKYIQNFWRGTKFRRVLRKWRDLPQAPPGDQSPLETLSVDPCLQLLLYHKTRPKMPLKLNISYFPLRYMPMVQGSIQLPDVSVLFLIGGINPSKQEDVNAAGQMMLRYHPRLNEWERCGMMPVPRHHHALTFLNGSVYVIGGCDPRLTFKRCMVATSTTFRFDVKRAYWTRLSDMNHARVYHEVTVLHDTLYVVGGKNEFGRMLASVECYDLLNDQWYELDQQLSCPRMAMGVAEYKGMLWVAGGMVHPSGKNKVDIIRDVDYYDPFNNKWMFKKSQLPTPRTLTKLAVANKRMYLLGGAVKTKEADEMYLSSLADILRYDAKTNHWLMKGKLRKGRHDCAVGVLGNSIYCIGGLSTKDESALSEVVAHDTVTKAWDIQQALPFPVTGTAVVTLPPKCY